MTKTEAGLAKRLRKQAKCVYLAAEKSVADDISDGLSQAASLIERQSRALVEAREALEGARGFIEEFVEVEDSFESGRSMQARELAATITAALTEKDGE